MRTVGLGASVHLFMMVQHTGGKATTKLTSAVPRITMGRILQRLGRRRSMAEVLVEFSDVVITAGGSRYMARACGSAVESGHWQGWVEFIDLETGDAVRSPRETTQPNRTDTVYWATGLTPVYLEGALQRALHPTLRARPLTQATPVFDGPAPDLAPEPPLPDSILNPFSVYRKGEALLRRQLNAFSVWHLVNIVRAHELSDLPATTLNAMPAPDLVDLIVAAVRDRSEDAVEP
jgi:hypothetical protein